MQDAFDFTPPAGAAAGCPLCAAPGGRTVWRDTRWRVVRVDDADFPAFYRVVRHDHVREFSDLPAPERARCLDLACAVERVLIDTLQPAKVNLASLGNVVPHLHWHVVARFDWDSRFPDPIWAPARREVQPPAAERLAAGLAGLDAAVAAALARL